MKNIGNIKVAASHYHGIDITYQDRTEVQLVVLSRCDKDIHKHLVGDEIVKAVANWKTMDAISLSNGRLETTRPKTLSGWMRRNFPDQDRRYYYWDGVELCTDANA